AGRVYADQARPAQHIGQARQTVITQRLFHERPAEMLRHRHGLGGRAGAVVGEYPDWAVRHMIFTVEVRPRRPSTRADIPPTSTTSGPLMTSSPRSARQQAAGRIVADILLEIKAVNFRPEQPYTLTAGWASPVYIDCRKLISYPRARRKVTELA